MKVTYLFPVEVERVLLLRIVFSIAFQVYFFSRIDLKIILPVTKMSLDGNLIRSICPNFNQ